MDNGLSRPSDKVLYFKALTSKCSAEVVPSILQSDSGSLFMTNIFKQLRTYIKLVHGKPITHRVKDQWNLLMVTPRACWLRECLTITPKIGLLESSLLNFITILPIIRESSVYRIQPWLEMRLELYLHLHHSKIN